MKALKDTCTLTHMHTVFQTELQLKIPLTDLDGNYFSRCVFLCVAVVISCQADEHSSLEKKKKINYSINGQKAIKNKLIRQPRLLRLKAARLNG